MVVRGRCRLIERREEDLDVVEAVVLVHTNTSSFFYQRGRDPGARLGRRMLRLEAGRHGLLWLPKACLGAIFLALRCYDARDALNWRKK